MPAVNGDIFKVTAIGDVGPKDEEVVNVYHCKLTTLIDGSDLTIRADLKAYIEAIYNILLPDLSTDWALKIIRFENVTQDLVLEDETSALVGSALGDLLPTQTCGFVWARTARKRVMGRKFFAGYTEDSNQSDASILPAAKTRLDQAGDAYHFPFAAASGNAWDTGVARVESVGPPRVVTFDAFIGDEVSFFWRTQRRRTTKQV